MLKLNNSNLRACEVSLQLSVLFLPKGTAVEVAILSVPVTPPLACSKMPTEL